MLALAPPLLLAAAVQFARNSRHPRARRKGATRHESLTIGFVPMIDCAILIAAQELGLFAKHGLHVTLQKEVGWATIREKLVHQEVDAIHSPASLAYTIHCGIGSVARPCLTAFVLSLNGSAITLSEELWQKGVRDVASLRKLINTDRQFARPSIGAVLEFSTQHYDLRRWLRSGGIDPERDVRIPFIPSPIIHRQLLDGHLDGYCVAEPWNSIVTRAGRGWVVATSAEISPRQVEKVLLVLQEFAEERSEEHLALVAALIEASAFCGHPANRKELIRILALSRYLNVPEALLRSSLIGPFDTGRGIREIEDFVVFHHQNANVPDREKGRQVFEQVRTMPAAQSCGGLRPELIGRVFREDLYRQAEARTGSSSSTPNRAASHGHPINPSNGDACSAASLAMALAG